VTRLAVPLSHLEGLSRPGQADLLAIAVAAERGGADQLVLSEHVALGAVLDGHPGAAGRFPFDADEEYPDPLVALAAVAAVTSTARMSTNIVIAPLRPAVLLAKLVATLDVVSAGRVDLGVGAGWYEGEFAAMGVPVAEREQRLEDTVGACRALWAAGPATFTSPSVSFEGLVCSPAPAQPGGPPVWFGGGASRRTARKVATLGDGWTVMGDATPDDIAAGVRLIAQACEAIGRDPAAVTVRCSLRPVDGDLERTMATAAAYVDAGASVVQLPSLRTFTREVAEVEAVVTAARSSLVG
jgi:probable F420-dependent oxidoreductase